MRSTLLPLLLTTALITACEDTDETPAPASTDQIETPTPEKTVDDAPLTMEEATAGDSNVALWKTGDEDTTVYLMGTIHILKPGLEWETNAFETAWAESDIIYFEADITSQEEMQAVAPVVMSEGFYTDGRTLTGLFTEEQISRIDESLEEYKLTVASLGNMRPWFASIQVAQLALTKAGGDPMAGIEMLLSARAKEEGKTERFFETPLEQIQMIAGIPDEVWATAFVEGMEDIADVAPYYAQMVGLWYRGDADGLANFMSDGWEETPELIETLLWERNERWAITLDKLIEDEPGTFLIAVGAGHLAGKDSLQDYLATHGHEVSRINP